MTENADNPRPAGPRTGDREPAHAFYRAMLQHHLDGEISPSDRISLFEHIEFCEDCRRTLEAEQRLLDRLSHLPRLVAPNDLRARLVAQATREHREARTALS